MSQAPQNPGLLFDRFAPARHAGTSEPWKKEGLLQVLGAANNADPQLLQASLARWESVAAAVGAQPFSLRTEWRLIAGIGRKGAYEVGFTFHRYGFPYLPGSSLKGLARSAGFWKIAETVVASPNGASDPDRWARLENILSLESTEDCEKKFRATYKSAEEDAIELIRNFRAAFGTIAAAGGAVFLDAIPVRLPRLDLDIMNPHYPQYYEGSQPPSNWQSPIPVYFLAVAPETEFRFGVGWRGEQQGDWASVRRLAEAWLRRGLTELGAGAKTSAGYGYFLGENDRDDFASESGERVATSQSAPVGPELPQERLTTQERIGTIVEIRPDLGRGRVKDDVTGREYPFQTHVIRGNFPSRRGRVVFILQSDSVIEVRRHG